MRHCRQRNSTRGLKLDTTPHIIHYCWFGGGELSDAARKTLASWERFAPGFEIRRCDESSFDVDACAWARDAYAAGKYAFVSDYARFRVLHDFGGVYMDLGSELVRDITPLVEACSPFSAIEELSKTANTGLVAAAPPHDPVVASVLARYEAAAFRDDPAFLRANTVNEFFTTELERYGFVRQDRLQHAAGWTLLPSEAFNPVYGLGGYHVKGGTYSVHRYSASWVEPELRIRQRVVDAISPLLGRRMANIVGRTIGEIRVNGLREGILRLVAVGKNVISEGR